MAATGVVLGAGRVNGPDLALPDLALKGVAAYAVMSLAILATLIALSSVLIGLMGRRRALDQFREAVQVMPEGLTIWGANDRLLAWNARVADLAETDVSMLHVGMHVTQYLRMLATNDPDIDPGNLEAWVRERRIARREPGAVFERRTHSGRWFRIENRPTTRGGLVTICVDITDFKRNAEILVQALEAAGAANKVQSEFLANMSHEIRTPLTSVLGYSDLLGNIAGLPPKAKTYIDRITTAGRALASIVNDLLDYSRLEAGKIKLDPHTFRLADFLDQTTGLISVQAINKGLAFKLEQRGVLPATVNADMSRLRQVMLNLLGNAVKFTEAGSVTLAISHEGENGGRLRFEVTDTGPGLSAEQAGRLFQRFSQIDGSNGRGHGGAGLGLAISKGLVQIMGGEIGVWSTVGRGSTFWFTIKAPAMSQADPIAVAESVDAGLAPLRILVVDDVAGNRELVAAMLEPFDVRLTGASGGREAVDAALTTGFNLILMDIQMPGMDGITATRTIRATSDLNRNTPILALSASVMPAELEACRQAGMNDHIGKPIDVGELLTKIALWTRTHSTPEGA